MGRPMAMQNCVIHNIHTPPPRVSAVLAKKRHSSKVAVPMSDTRTAAYAAEARSPDMAASEMAERVKEEGKNRKKRNKEERTNE